MRSNKLINLSIYILIILLMSSAILFAKHIEERKIESYTTSYYLNFYNKILVPQIEEYISNFQLAPYSQEKGEKLVTGVIQIIQNHVKSNNILLKEGMQYPVTLVVVPPNDNGTIIYYLNLVITVIEYDSRSKITSLLMLSKNFFCGMESLSKKQDV